jgi:hypothetical protein
VKSLSIIAAGRPGEKERKEREEDKNVVKNPAVGKHYIYCIHFPHILQSIINNTSGQTTFSLPSMR